MDRVKANGKPPPYARPIDMATSAEVAVHRKMEMLVALPNKGTRPLVTRLF